MTLTRNPNLTTASLGSLAAGEPLALPWTGRPPAECPGVQPDGTLTSLPLPDLARCTRGEVQAYFDNGWTLTEVLFSALRCREALHSPPYHHLRHPLVFYYCHPPALYVNKLRLAGLCDAPLDPELEALFETGVDEMSWDDMSKNTMDWPPLDALIDYRRRVHRLVSDVIATHPDLADGHAPLDWEHPLWALFMGFEHERIHLETSSVLIRELPLDWVRPPEHWPPRAPATSGPAPAAAPLALREAPGGAVRLGKARDVPTYGWDNEHGADTRQVAPFSLSATLVTNAQLHEFVVAGGYRRRELWSELGWKWREFRNVKWPTFWAADGPAGLHRYKLRAPFELIDLPWDWPALVNYHEAKAYARWRSLEDGVRYRLPTEAELAALRPAGGDDPVRRASGADLRAEGLNLNLAWGSEGPVSSAQGPRGDVWRWVEDDFHPLPGARVHPYYDDFSTPCYDGEHTMILGGSFASTGDEASVFARFHFRPHFFQHAGFQLVCAPAGDDGAVVKLAAPGTTEAGKYEQQAVLAQYLELHFGAPDEAMPLAAGPREAAGFPRRCAELLLDVAREAGVEVRRALDVGCGVGGASFAPARVATEVIGVDLSAAFVDTCQALARDGSLAYEAVEEGELRDPRVARVDPAVDRARVSFRRADAQSLPPDLLEFDAVLAANLLDRLASPMACLSRLGGPRGLVRPGGVLLVTSPYTWRAEFTPREVWLGGLERDGRRLRTADELRGVLEAAGFELLREADLPLVIREHRRKYELVIPHATAWRRREDR